MTIPDAVQVLRDHNAWRRGGDGPPTDPRRLGEALDLAVDELERLTLILSDVKRHVDGETDGALGFIRRRIEELEKS